jgi:hypothetical protein
MVQTTDRLCGFGALRRLSRTALENVEHSGLDTLDQNAATRFGQVSRERRRPSSLLSRSGYAVSPPPHEASLGRGVERWFKPPRRRRDLEPSALLVGIPASRDNGKRQRGDPP